MKNFFRLFVSLLAISVYSLSSVYSVPVSAHEGEDHTHDQPAISAPAEAYEFEVPAGGSLSTITRRALQLYDQANDQVTLTPAAAIFAETTIVKRLGDRYLEVGEKVRLETKLLQEVTESAKQLTSEQTAGWQFYADQADFNVGYLDPTSAVATNNQGTSSDATEGQDEAAEANENADETMPDQKAPWYWWVIGAGTLVVLYYLLGGRAQKK